MLRIDQAGAGDDRALRSLVRRLPMPGSVQVAYTREPSFFSSLCVHGTFNQVIVARNGTSRGEIAGLGVRSVKPAFMTSGKQTLGYLNSMRLEKKHRGFGAMLRGFRLLEGLHGDGRTDLYLTTILESNTRARALLESGRMGLPRYEFAGKVHFAALTGRKVSRNALPKGCEVRFATSRDMPGVLELLERNCGRRRFVPRYRMSDLGEGGLLQGLRPQDVAVCVADGKVVASVGMWDQTFKRQALVTGYSVAYGAMRPMYNWAARLRKRPSLPAPGEELSTGYLALCAAENDNVTLFGSALALLLEKGPVNRKYALCAFHEKDPLLQALQGISRINYDSRLYVVFWPDGREAHESSKEGIPYIEAGAL